MWWLQKSKVPLLVVRYEDLVVRRRESLERIARFLSKEPSLSGTKWEKRIEEMCEPLEAQGFYQRRAGAKKIGASIERFYSADLLQGMINAIGRQFLAALGYMPGSEPGTGFPDVLPMPAEEKCKRPGVPGNTLRVNDSMPCRRYLHLDVIIAFTARGKNMNPGFIPF